MKQWLLTQVSQRLPGVVFSVPTSRRLIALTIDDVPTPKDPGDESTRRILAAIDAHNQTQASPPARATFFVITDHLSADSTVLSDVLAQGHEVGNHGTSDTMAARLSEADFRAQFQIAHERLVSLTGLSSRWYRPGQGFYGSAMLRTLKQAPGYEPRVALASHLPLDTWPWTDDPALTYRYLQHWIFPGAILVMHGGTRRRSDHTAEVLARLLPDLTTQGYQVTTLSHLWDSTASPESIGC